MACHRGQLILTDIYKLIRFIPKSIRIKISVFKIVFLHQLYYSFIMCLCVKRV